MNRETAISASFWHGYKKGTAPQRVDSSFLGLFRVTLAQVVEQRGRGDGIGPEVLLPRDGPDRLARGQHVAPPELQRFTGDLESVGEQPAGPRVVVCLGRRQLLDEVREGSQHTEIERLPVRGRDTSELADLGQLRIVPGKQCRWRCDRENPIGWRRGALARPELERHGNRLWRRATGDERPLCREAGRAAIGNPNPARRNSVVSSARREREMDRRRATALSPRPQADACPLG